MNNFNVFLYVCNTTILPMFRNATKCHILLQEISCIFLKSHKNN